MFDKYEFEIFVDAYSNIFMECLIFVISELWKTIPNIIP